MNSKDEIVDAGRAAREAYAARFNYDLAEMYKDLKAKEQAHRRKIAALAPVELRMLYRYINPNGGLSRLQTLLLEQGVESAAGISRAAGPLLVAHGGRGWSGGGRVASDGYAGLEQRTLVGLVLERYPHRNRLQALETGGGLEVGTLLATVQGGSAFRAVAAVGGSVGKLRGAVVTSGGGNGLHQARQARAGYIEGRTRAGLAGPVASVSIGSWVRAVGVLIASLSVLAITIHGKLGLLLESFARVVTIMLVHRGA